MLPIEFVFEENLEPARSLATDRWFLKRPKNAVLRCWTAPGDLLSAGRYHRVSPSASTGPIYRRLSGGRAMPFGEGFLGVSLVLPHRSALVSEEPFHLSPYQVPNRYVRGLLTALKSFGVDAFYPGRDFVTVRRKVLAMVTFETDERGGLLFEAILALDRDFAAIGPLLERADPEKTIGGERLDPEGTTRLAVEAGKRVPAREAAEAIRAGFAEQFRVEATPRDISSLEEQAIAAIETREFGESWIGWRTPRSDLGFNAIVPVSLGVFEVSFALEQERFLREVQLSGDFIANSAGVETLERELRLCPADWRSIALVADQVFNRPENYILGIGKLRTIPDAIVKALPA